MLSAGIVESLLLTSCGAMMKVFAVIVVGATIAQVPRGDPYLPKEALKYMSRLSNSVFLPNLIVTALGSSLTPKSLSMMSVLILFSIVNMMVSYLLAITLGKYLNKDDPATFESLIVAIASPNAISLPIMVMTTLCEQPIVANDFGGDSLTCQIEATAMLFVYSVGWHLMFWSFGFPELQRIKKVHVDKIAVKATVSWKEAAVEFFKDWVSRVALSGVMLAIFIGIIVGSWPALKNALFFESSFLRPFGSAMVTLAQPVVCLNSVIMAASLAMVPKEELIEQLQRVLGPCAGILTICDITKSEEHTSTNSKRIEYGSVASTSRNFINKTNIEDETLGDCISNPIYDQDTLGTDDNLIFTASEVRAFSLEAGGSKSNQLPETKLTDLTKNRNDRNNECMSSKKQIKYHSDRLILIHTLCRLIVPPILMIFLVTFIYGSNTAYDTGFYRLLRLVVVVESGQPSAQVVMVCIQQLEVPFIATRLSYLYIYQYLFAIVTITIFTSIIMSLLYF